MAYADYEYYAREYLIGKEPVISEELTELAKYLAVTTFCPLFEAVKAMLPPGLNFKPVYKYFANGESENEEEQRIINWLRKKKNGAEAPLSSDKIPIPTNESVIGCLYPIKFPITVITENIINNTIQLKIP